MVAGIKSIFGQAKSSPIPQLQSVAGWKEIPIKECGEPLVPLGPFLSQDKKEGFLKGQADAGFSDRIFQDAIYWGERASSPYQWGELDGSLLTPFVREGVAKRLVKAASYLPKGHAFLIWDSYRPLSVQEALYNDFYRQLIEKKGMQPEQAAIEAQRFVSISSKDETRPSPHNTGASIDLTIIKFAPEVLAELDHLNQQLRSKDWQEQYRTNMRYLQLVREFSTPLNMGTEFDAVLPQTATRYYEERLEAGNKLSQHETECLINRRLFHSVMWSAGFSNYAEEWWHFDSGNQFDAKRTGGPAIYGAANFSEECIAWEKMRTDHYQGTLRFREPVSPTTKLGDSELVELVREQALDRGNLKSSRHSKAQRLEV